MRVLIVGTGDRLQEAIQSHSSEHEWTTVEPAALIDDNTAWHAVRNVQAIVHLGGLAETPDDVRTRMDNATRGTYKLLKAAVDAGVRRVVVAGTLRTFAPYPLDVYVTEHARPLPSDEPEQMLPHLCETVCREFARDCRVGITCLRFGQLVDAAAVGDRAPSLDATDYGDAAAAVHLALQRDGSDEIHWVRRWAVYHVTSGRPNPRFLLDGARIVGREPLGYTPSTHFESADPPGPAPPPIARTDLDPPTKVLLIGSGGMIAPRLVPFLNEHYDLTLADLDPGDDPRTLRVDVTDYGQVHAAAEGMDALSNWTVIRQEVDGAFAVNVIGAWNVMRAAVDHGIRRVLHTGPQCIRGHYDWDFDVEDVPRAPGIGQYGLTKLLSYEICRIYARVYGIQIVCYVFNGLHAGPDKPKTETDVPPMTIVYEDLAVACKLALDLPRVPDDYHEFNMLSYESHGKYNVNKARRILGFEPTEDWGRYYRRLRIED